MPARAIAAVLLALAGSVFAADMPPALPEGYDLALGDAGDALWVSLDMGHRRRVDHFFKLLHAATGELQPLPLPTDFAPELAVPMGDGLVLAGEDSVFPAVDNPPQRVVWYAPPGGVVSVLTIVQRRVGRMLALADQSVLLVGGRLSDGSTRTNAVERVRRTPGGLEIERLPDIPGPVRHGYALVALADGRAMVLGGTESQYTGCGHCLADTYILDPKTKAWSAGPKMLEPRADASATLLPDGSILVAGGWTPGHDWNEEAARTSERWDARRNAFVAGPPLPIAVAMHKALWAAGARGRQLLLAGGMVRAWEGNDAVVAFDVAKGELRTVGAGCAADNKDGALDFGSRVYRDMLFAWCGSPYYRGRGDIRLQSPTAAPTPTLAGERGHAFRRGGAAYSGMAQKGGAMLVAGGTLADSGTVSAAADIVSADGQIRTLASLEHARRGARAFALPDGGFLVAGGIGGLLRDRPGTDAYKLSMEWLPGQADLVEARWRDVEPWFSHQDAVGQEADGSLIVVTSLGSVTRMTIEVKDGQLLARRTTLPNLNRYRQSGDQNGQAADVRVRSLPDGRIVVTGGLLRQQAIAVLAEESLDADAPDAYAEVGEWQLARRYETYDPAARSWRTSASSLGQGGPVTILDTGQVVMVTPSKITGDQRPDGTWPTSAGTLEISSTDGTSWRPFEAFPLVKLDEHARPFVIQGELLLTGAAAKADTGGGPSLLQWYDSGNRRWVTLWEAPANTNWREHLGRVIVRELANGKRLVIPVEGM